MKKEKEIEYEKKYDFDISNIKIIQEVPCLFNNLELSGAETVRTALFISKKLNLIPANSPLRSIFYSLIKLSLCNIKNPPKNLEICYYRTFTEIIRESPNLYYSDFNIENKGVIYKNEITKGFGNTIIGIEKESYFGVVTNLAELLGVSIYAFGGQPSMSATEYFYKRLYQKNDINFFVITDFDPAGLNIYNTIKEQMSIYCNRETKNFTCKRIGILPEYYEPDELKLSLYQCKLTNHESWNTTEITDIRKTYNMNKEHGLEIESLPADPGPVFFNLFPDLSKPKNWTGQSRMRLIILKEIIEMFGINNYMKNYLENCFNTRYDSLNIINNTSKLFEIKEIKLEIENIIDNISNLCEKMLETEYEQMEQKINNWKEDIIKEKINDKQYITEFKQKLVNAVANDETYLERDLFEIPNEIKESIKIPETKKEIIEKIKNKLQLFLEEIRNIYESYKNEINI